MTKSYFFKIKHLFHLGLYLYLSEWRSLRHEYDECEKAVETLSNTLTSYLRYHPTNEERFAWAREVLETRDKLSSARDLLLIAKIRIKDASECSRKST